MQDPVDNQAIVGRLFAFVGRRGGESADDRAVSFADDAALYHPDVAIHAADCLPDGGCYQAPECVTRHAQAFRLALDGLQTTGDASTGPRFRSGENEIVVCRALRDRLSRSGERFEIPVVSVYRLLDGRIVEARLHHFDASATAAFLQPAQREEEGAEAANLSGDS